MKVAVVGSGIAGNAAAFAFSHADHISKLVIYERDLRPGGHSATVDVHYDGEVVPVDTGFIVYNEANYPLLTKLFDYLDVPTKLSDMGFSFSLDSGRREWAGLTTGYVNGFFAQRRNALSPRHWLMLREMTRFTTVCRKALDDNAIGRLTLGEFLTQHRFSAGFRDDYILPMASAIWSTPLRSILDFPASSFVHFFENHRLLSWNRPLWRTVDGGSRRYVDRITQSYRRSIRLGTAVIDVQRQGNRVIVTDASGESETFDHVVLACHSDQSLAMLSDASDEERNLLAAIRYRPNSVYLHRDERLMPRRKAAWAAWNFLKDSADPDANDVTLTYWMNKLQGIDPKKPLFVTLNPREEPAPETIFARFSYDHPQYDQLANDAQKALEGVQGRGHVWFAGAWTGYGFHEDGLRSGLQVAEALGAVAPWLKPALPQIKAAE
jgi:uncharacterized protein